MKACVFLGPSISIAEVPDGICVFPPATMGSVFSAVEEGFSTIGLVDGLFGNVPSVWHKEILYALSRNCRVLGAASMGALRASELHSFGMRGVGTVYQLYRRGLLRDDDEVCVCHAPAEFDYIALSHPMVNLRLTARRMARKNIISTAQEKKFIHQMKNVFFADRTTTCVVDGLLNVMGTSDSFGTNKTLSDMYYDAKAADAKRLLSALLIPDNQCTYPLAWNFPITSHWRDEFERNRSELPALKKQSIIR